VTKRITYDLMKSKFEREGYIYLDAEYKNSKTKLKYRCSKGHEHSMNWDSWKDGHRCPSCYGNTKPTLEQVIESFNKEGYNLLSKEYVNAKTKLYYVCSKGHKHSIRWNNWKQGQRCLYCSGLFKPTLEYIKKSLEKENYILLSKKYINAYTKLNYKCYIGHTHSIKWNDWQQGVRCPTCANIKMSGPGNPSWNGGTSYEPYCPIWSDKEYKNDVKERDGHRCLNPYCDKKNNKLHIHHIDYNKKNCHPSNLITVCNSCNARANIDREWHTAWYRALIYRRYKYDYNYDR
jgi:hypothetical protein